MISAPGLQFMENQGKPDRSAGLRQSDSGVADDLRDVVVTVAHVRSLESRRPMR